jgi:hypothetical protein
MTAATRDTRAQRTPRPWTQVGPATRRTVDGYATEAVAIAARGESIAVVFAGHRGESNAAYIVRACNAHDALVDALRECCAALYDDQSARNAGAYERAMTLLAQLDAA